MKNDIRKQNEIVEDGVRRQEMIGEEANNILGDKLHQKMDSIAFTQERMKRQVDDLQDKIGGAPNDIGDLRDRIEDVERDVSKGPDTSKIEADILELKSDVDKVLGKDESGRGEVDGIPSLTKLQTDVDELKNNMSLVQEKVPEMETSLDSKISNEKQDRIDETAGLRREVERLEKKQKALKSKLKSKLGVTGITEDTDKEEDEGNE